jgi:hypothetical protein
MPRSAFKNLDVGLDLFQRTGRFVAVEVAVERDFM